jgi:hypothetical protein
MIKLCKALILDVAAAWDIPIDKVFDVIGRDDRVLTAQMGARITGWANHRLGIVNADLMSEVACKTNTLARHQKMSKSTGDTPIR